MATYTPAKNWQLLSEHIKSELDYGMQRRVKTKYHDDLRKEVHTFFQIANDLIDNMDDIILLISRAGESKERYQEKIADTLDEIAHHYHAICKKLPSDSLPSFMKTPQLRNILQRMREIREFFAN